ncbi:MAG TPA: AAA family ATPase [Dehalococcoidales bacterium]|jgi:CO dehydrogenase maturation factor|nr:AAA family ATPase [Dehalococcoidales bacterium]
MSIKIAVAGKGGCGKTSITALVIRYLKKNGKTPILAVDADPNANLGESLGLKVPQTIGRILDDFQHEKISIPPGMTKEAYLDYKLNETLVESQGLDLITMGRGQGPECYCYPNTVLKKFIDGLSDSYAYVVMDNEAGMEHLSRKTTEDVDALLLVSNHSVKGVRAIGRILELVGELKLHVKKKYILINMVPDKLDPLVADELKRLGLKADIIIPEDKTLYRHDLEQKPLMEMPDNSPAVQAVARLMAEL